MTLARLKVLQESGLFNVAGMARQIGVEPQTLSIRMKRGRPELTVTESERLEEVLVTVFNSVGAHLNFPKSYQVGEGS